MSFSELPDSAGFPGFSEIAKPLFKAIAGSGKDSLECGPEQEKAFEEIKRLLTHTPTLGLSDVTWDFNLFLHEKNHTALGVLTQKKRLN